MLLKIPLVDIGGGLPPPVQDLHRVIAALDFRQVDERAALLVERDPGLAVENVEIGVRPIDAPRRAVDDLVPLEAFLEIEIFLPQHEQAPEHVFVRLDDVAVGKALGRLRVDRAGSCNYRKRCESKSLHSSPPHAKSILNSPLLPQEISISR